MTLLLANAAAMEALPIFLNHLIPDWLAIIVSVTAVLFFGEYVLSLCGTHQSTDTTFHRFLLATLTCFWPPSNLYLPSSFFSLLLLCRIIPQAICSRWALQIGGNIWWLVWGLMGLLFPLSFPISKLLDWILGHKSGVYYKRAQLKEFVAYHAASAFEQQPGAKTGDVEQAGTGGEDGTSSSDSDDGGLPKEERLTNDEVLIIKGALDLTSKTVTTSMTGLENVFSLNEATMIDSKTLQTILDSGHSRVPLWRDHPSNYVGMLLVKTLNLNFILEGGIIARADIKELPLVDATTPLYTMLNIFQTGRSHMAGVLGPNSTSCIGVITLEDIIEELIQEEIEDETDLWRREHLRVKRRASATFHHKAVGLSFETESGVSFSLARSKSGSVMDRHEQKKRSRRVRERAKAMEWGNPGTNADHGGGYTSAGGARVSIDGVPLQVHHSHTDDERLTGGPVGVPSYSSADLRDQPIPASLSDAETRNGGHSRHSSRHHSRNSSEPPVSASVPIDRRHSVDLSQSREAQPPHSSNRRLSDTDSELVDLDL